VKYYLFFLLNYTTMTLVGQDWQWAKSYDADYYDTEYGENIGVDKFGNAYVTGYYKNWNGPTVRVMWKYNKDGDLLWRKPALPVSKLITDPAGFSYALSSGKIYKFDPDGNYSLFIYDSTIYPVSIAFYPSGGFVISGFTFNQQGLVARFDSLGNKAWVSLNDRYGNGMQTNAVATDPNGNTYCIGYNLDTMLNSKFLIIKLNSSGIIEKVNSILDSPQMITVDNLSNIYATNGGEINKYNSDGELLWTKIIEAKAPSYFPWLMTDEQNNLYIAGHFIRNFKIDGNELPYTNYTDVYACKFNSVGKFEWGARSSDGGHAVVLNATLSKEHEIYFTGGYGQWPVFGKDSLKCESIYGNMYTAKMKDNSVVSVKETATVQSQTSFVVRPNPSNGNFSVRYTDTANTGELRFKIVNVLGETVYLETVPDFKGILEKELNLGQLKRGCYFVLIQNGGSNQTSKIVIQ
jgi:hypothetical protein